MEQSSSFLSATAAPFSFTGETDANVDVTDNTNTDDTDTTTSAPTSKAPIYITIGPQCAGKTTLLSKITKEQEQGKLPLLQLEDITIDDQNGVHIPTPTSLWLSNQQPTRKNRTARTSSLLRTVVHGKTIAERIYEDVGMGAGVNGNHEMRFVIQRLHKAISAYEFRQCILSLNTNDSATGNNHHRTNQYHHNNHYHNNSAGRRNNGDRAGGGRRSGGGENDIDRQINSNLRQLYKKESSQSRRNSSSSSSVDWKECLIHAVEEFHKKRSRSLTSNNNTSNIKESLPSGSDTIQLFVVESIFKNPPLALISSLSSLSLLKNDINNKDDTNGTNNDFDQSIMMTNGLNAATKKLNHLAMDQNTMNQHQPLAWGNTNAKKRDYVTALEAAEKSRRPVIFIPYMNERQQSCLTCSLTKSLENNDTQVIEDRNMILNRVEMNELFQRNIQRCFSVGRYVPMRAIIETSLRVDEFMDRVVLDMKSEYGAEGNTKFQLDFTLSKVAGFHMNDDRTVCQIVANNSKSNTNSSTNSSTNSNSSGNSNGNSFNDRTRNQHRSHYRNNNNNRPTRTANSKTNRCREKK